MLFLNEKFVLQGFMSRGGFLSSLGMSSLMAQPNFDGIDASANNWILNAAWTNPNNYDEYKGVKIPYNYNATTKTGSPAPSPTKAGYTLMWSDEFDATTLSATRLNPSGNGCLCDANQPQTCNPDNPNPYANNSPQCPTSSWNPNVNLPTQVTTNWVLDISRPSSHNNFVPVAGGASYDTLAETVQPWFPGTPDYVYTENGNLVIKATKEMKTRTFSNGKTKPYAKIYTGQVSSPFRMRYGYYEARIKMPKVEGGWGALWTWNNSPTWSEIDMPEFFFLDVEEQNGQNAQKFNDFHSFHSNYIYQYQIGGNGAGVNYYNYNDPVRVFPTKDAGVGGYTLDLTDDYFIYGVEWSPTQVIQYVNGVAVNTLPSSLNQKEPMGLIVGMSFHDYMNINSTVFNTWPYYMLVDYVRVYKKTSQLSADLLEFLPNIACIGQTFMFEVYDNYPQYTHEWSVISAPASYNPNNSNMAITFNKPNIYNGFVNVTVPSSTPAGSYTFKLKIKNGTQTVAEASKSLTINTVPVPAQPGTITIMNMDAVECTASIAPVANATSYEWMNGNTILPSTGTSADFFTGTFNLKVRAKNHCGVSPWRTRIGACTCSNCTSRMMQSDSTDTLLEEVITEEAPTKEIIEETSNFSFSPNPLSNTNKISLNIKDWKEPCNFYLLTMEGITLQHWKLESAETTLRLPNLQKGNYTLLLEKEGIFTRQTLVIQ